MINKALKKLAEERNLTYDTGRDAVYGRFDDYYVVFAEPNKQEISITFSVKSEDEYFSRDQVGSFLSSLQRENEVMASHFYNGYQIMMNVKAFKSEDYSKVEAIVRQTSSFLKSVNMINCCQHCGETNGAFLGSLCGNVGVNCSSCLNKFGNNQKGEPAGNLPLGIIGALGGSLIGVAAWIAIYQIGFIAGIAGWLMFFCAFKGYQMLGKRIDMKGVVISCVISVIMLFLSEMACIVIIMKQEWGITVMDCIKVLPDVMKDSEIAADVVKELLVGYALMIWATASSVKQCAKQAKNHAEAVRLQ